MQGCCGLLGPRRLQRDDADPQSPVLIQFLTPKQRQMIIKTWQRISDKEAFGERIFVHIFVRQPELQSRFGYSDQLDLRQNAKFTKQAINFVEFLQKVVDKVGENKGKKLEELCVRMGEAHACLIQGDLRPEWLSVFVSCLLSCLQPFCRSAPPVLDAWGILMEKVVSWMQSGFKKARTIDVVSATAIDNDDISAPFSESSRRV